MSKDIQDVEKNEDFDLKKFAEELGDLEQGWRGRGTDWFLQDLARWVNKMGIEFSISLHTPAGVVSGTAISHEKYFKTFAEQFVGPWAGDAAGDLQSVIEGFGKPVPDEEDSNARLQYIHLKDARFFAPGQKSMPNNGVLWRGKISSVCSFHLGQLIDPS
ncbi:hypothetical protein OC926_25890 [Pseudomonas peradeniyensis]|uniref:gas vesicle accessory protein GvpU n=1 Tax=Pseudomonas peradeniyensis TaxID=2745488 RepID=UPI0021D5099A|nr:gas vesicle accessory protein GvpU [Pseudomonas peradeniyensis]MCU7283269.1 hypothetical protein [Pseudomonas peradeniyensis]